MEELHWKGGSDKKKKEALFKDLALLGFEVIWLKAHWFGVPVNMEKLEHYSCL